VQDDVLTQNKQVDYADGFQYENNIIQFFPTAEGYASRLTTKIEQSGQLIKIPIEELPEDQFSYVYNYTDHLGNIRLSYSLDPDTQQLKIVEQNHYYPFGMRHTNYSGGRMVMVKDEELKRMAPATEEFLTYTYKYNGKEYQDELGLNFYDYGARNYDPALGRWVNIDKKAEKYPAWSPYVFALDNPVRYIDPDGNEVQDPIKEIVDKGMQSQTFQTLYSKAGLTDTNYGSIIKMGREISNTDANGNITINKRVSGDRAVLDLTHELTNRVNIGELNALSYQVANGKISSEDYAYGIIAIESEALVNQYVVAKELGINFGENAGGMNQVLAKFASGEISFNQLQQLVYDNMDSNKVGGADGQSAVDFYKQQGDDLRKQQQKLDENSKDNKDEKK
jgi:RHS repeat-associated protein